MIVQESKKVELPSPALLPTPLANARLVPRAGSSPVAMLVTLGGCGCAGLALGLSLGGPWLAFGGSIVGSALGALVGASRLD